MGLWDQLETSGETGGNLYPFASGVPTALQPGRGGRFQQIGDGDRVPSVPDAGQLEMIGDGDGGASGPAPGQIGDDFTEVPSPSPGKLESGTGMGTGTAGGVRAVLWTRNLRRMGHR
jgi:hypothetical protein